MSAHNRLIVCKALLAVTDEFIATPKYNERHSTMARFPGICAQVREVLDHNGGRLVSTGQTLEWLYSDWKHHSGAAWGFPIPSGKRGVSAQDYYYQMMTKEKLWDKTTRYGLLRWDLLKHMRTRAQAYVDDMAELAVSSNTEQEQDNEQISEAI